MVAYHFIYDLNYFGYLQLQMNQEPIWIIFRSIILCGFFLSVGMSLAWNVNNTSQLNRYSGLLMRTLKLLLSAVLVTIVSIVLFPKSWIFFGVLHFILLATWVTWSVRHRPKIALTLAGVVLIEHFFQLIHFSKWFLDLRIVLGLPMSTEDFVPPVPWLAVVFFGIYLGHSMIQNNSKMNSKMHRKTFKAHPASKSLIHLSQILSRHSLIIYLIHQPILFAMIIIFNKTTFFGIS